MSNVVWFISFQLVEGANEEEFLMASKRVHDEVLSKQKGFVSWNILRDGDTWVDLVTWESEEAAKNGEKAGNENPIAHEFYSFLNCETITAKNYSIEKTY